MYWIIPAAVLLLTALFLLRSSYERKTLSVSEYTLESGKIPASFDGYRMVYLTDLHDDIFGPRNEQLAEKVRELKPDIVLIGGDMTSAQIRHNAEPFKAWDDLMAGLQGIPSVLSFGNHEYRIYTEETYEPWRGTGKALVEKYGITVLHDEKIELRREGDSILLYGTDPDPDYYKHGRKRPFPDHYVENRLGKADPERFTVLLSHTPLYMEEYTDWGADLVLSGHFHGGTIRLPGLGGVMTPQFQFFSKYCRGRVACEKGLGIVSGGLGTHSINLRFNNKPDIVLIRLKKAG
ncbi:MAG: metallophosphoesterase [Lachnospiraceae bacterium]|nr:metallophosphoesterase [Lachnospiraceae bacterium]